MASIIGYILAALAGLSLGLIGSGGSILTVPILVYLFKIEPALATGYSLFVVGASSLVGSLQNAGARNIHFKTAFVFGFPSIIAVFLTRAYLVPSIPEILFSIGTFSFSKSIFLMTLFAITMIFASISMIKGGDSANDDENSALKYNYPLILLDGLLVGTLTGLVGAGGGFLIIPALVILVKMPMKQAIGTSLLIIAVKSLLGFLGELSAVQTVDWRFLLIFTSLSILGILLGVLLAQKIDGKKLKKGFGYFVLMMGIFIFIKELLFIAG